MPSHTASRNFQFILCVDFDGVLHGYQSGWKGAEIIPDPPVPGAMHWLEEAVIVFDVHIYSARSSQPGGIVAMAEWLERELERELGSIRAMEVFKRITFAETKPSAFLTIDDRALQFDGDWFSKRWNPSKLAEFKPWNK